MRQYAFVVTLLAAILLGTAAQCEPIERNLDSFKVLMSDYSATSGGMQPAITKDGSMLVFWTRSGKANFGSLYTLSDTDLMYGLYGDVTPGQLTFPVEGAGVDLNDVPSDDTPTMDWSPDGERLAVAHHDGCLYVLENVKRGEKRSLNARVLAKPSRYKGDKKTGRYFNPKWSPDGKKIVVLRQRENYGSLVEVFDVQSGKSTILADDAFMDEHAFSQPWSPDSTKIVYAAWSTPTSTPTKTVDLSDTACCPGLFVVPVDGGPKRKLPVGRGCLSPWWSLKSGRISFVQEQLVQSTAQDQEGIFRFAEYAIRTIAETGSAPETLFASRQVSASELSKFLADIAAASRKVLEREYSSLMTQKQLHLLKTGKLDNRIADVAMFFVAKHMGGRLWSLAKIHEKDLGTGKFNLQSDAAFVKATRALVDKPLDEYNRRVDEVDDAAFEEWLELQPDSYLGLYWSPDDTRVATIVSTGLFSQKLVVLDTKTKKQIDVCTGVGIGCVSWVGNKTLVAQVSRMMYSDLDKSGDFSCDYPGYPEIWMMTLK